MIRIFLFLYACFFFSLFLSSFSLTAFSTYTRLLFCIYTHNLVQVICMTMLPMSICASHIHINRIHTWPMTSAVWCLYLENCSTPEPFHYAMLAINIVVVVFVVGSLLFLLLLIQIDEICDETTRRKDQKKRSKTHAKCYRLNIIIGVRQWQLLNKNKGTKEKKQKKHIHIQFVRSHSSNVRPIDNAFHSQISVIGSAVTLLMRSLLCWYTFFFQFIFWAFFPLSLSRFCSLAFAQTGDAFS